jgi:hypothetical protein
MIPRAVHAHQRSRPAPADRAPRARPRKRARQARQVDKYHLLILDDIAYVSKDQAETSVLFELIGSRYERRSMLITANQPFGEWGKVFPDQAMTLAAIDRLVHHATILEMNVESYRLSCRTRPQAWSRWATGASDNQGQGLIDAPRQSENGTKKMLAIRRIQRDHSVATGRRFTPRLPPPFSSRLSRDTSGLLVHAPPVLL